MESFDEIISNIHVLFQDIQSNALMVVNENYEKHMISGEEEQMIEDQANKIGVDIKGEVKVKFF